jgi:hypothetical protein
MNWVDASLIYEEVAIIREIDPGFDVKLSEGEFELLRQFNHDHLYYFYAGSQEALKLGSNELRKLLA